MSEVEVRKLPKTTIYIILILCILGGLFYGFTAYTREAKMSEVLANLGHKNISNVTVYKVSEVEDKDTKLKGTLYKLKFKDLTLNKECLGFVLKNGRGKYKKDVDCK